MICNCRIVPLLYVEKPRFLSYICYLSKRISCETSFKIPSATPPPALLAIPFTVKGTILQLQITMEFHRQLINQHHLQSHINCGNDPTVTNHNGILSTANTLNIHETRFTMPSRNGRTAEVDHRGSGTDCVWKNQGVFRPFVIF